MKQTCRHVAVSAANLCKACTPRGGARRAPNRGTCARSPRPSSPSPCCRPPPARPPCGPATAAATCACSRASSPAAASAPASTGASARPRVLWCASSARPAWRRPASPTRAPSPRCATAAAAGAAPPPPAPPRRPARPSAPTASPSRPRARRPGRRGDRRRQPHRPHALHLRRRARARWEDRGYDCSGSVSYALHGAGLLDAPLDSTALRDWGEAGAGRVDHDLRERRPRLRGHRRPALRHQRPARLRAPAGRPRRAAHAASSCAIPRVCERVARTQRTLEEEAQHG